MATSPAGYFGSLKEQEPVVAWDDKGRGPVLQTEADWISAGEVVFHAPLVMNTNVAVEDVRDKRWLSTTGAPVAVDGTIPGVQYVIRKKGVVELGSMHTVRVLPHQGLCPTESKLKGSAGQSAHPARRRLQMACRRGRGTR